MLHSSIKVGEPWRKSSDIPRGFMGGGEEVGAISMGLYNTPLVSGIHKFPSIRLFLWSYHQELLSICSGILRCGEMSNGKQYAPQGNLKPLSYSK